jgi:predicted alpha/beta-hydrolase family hydrolase
VALVEQPYRVAGRRSPAPAGHLDEAWSAVVQWLREHELGARAVVTGGRSSGARVACRTAAATGSAGVLCLAFPLRPPQRAAATKAAPDRLPELEAVTVPTLVVQGVSDRFGMPPAGPARTVVAVTGDHGLKSDLPAVQQAVADWLTQLVAAAGGPASARA